MTRVKICGLTLAADVRRCTELGVWACGFVLTESPRRVAPERAAELAAVAGETLTVAVVTVEAPDDVAGLLAASGLQAVQLSAGADGPNVADVRAAAGRRGLRPPVIAAADAPDAATADYVLADARSPGRYGGGGERADWAAAARLSDGGPPLILAGGLRPSNVDAAVKLVRPFAVDVAGGVERSPGRKDHGLLLAFCGAVAGADHSGGARP